VAAGGTGRVAETPLGTAAQKEIQSAGTGTNSYPNSWIRLTRVGNTFTGYFSTDGVNWTVVSSTTMALPSTIYLGFAVCSRTAGQLATAQFRDVSLS
jgi:regulation of enolase protein 1 (concanavalin A-like superfamily)